MRKIDFTRELVLHWKRLKNRPSQEKRPDLYYSPISIVQILPTTLMTSSTVRHWAEGCTVVSPELVEACPSISLTPGSSQGSSPKPAVTARMGGILAPWSSESFSKAQPWKSLLIGLWDNLPKPYSDTEVHLVLAVPTQHRTQWLHASPQHGVMLGQREAMWPMATLLPKNGQLKQSLWVTRWGISSKND